MFWFLPVILLVTVCDLGVTSADSSHYYDWQHKHWVSANEPYIGGYPKPEFPWLPAAPWKASQSVPIPPPSAAARLARYIAHNADVASVATVSVIPSVRGYPFVSIHPVSDGPKSKPSGVPFFYLAGLDTAAQDLFQNYHASVMLTQPDSHYCREKKMDVDDPRCTYLVLTGKLKKVKIPSPELPFAEEAMFTRHPIMKTYSPDHHWYFAKLKIEQVALMSYSAGPRFINVREYFWATPELVKPNQFLGYLGVQAYNNMDKDVWHCCFRAKTIKL